ncbi:MAG: DnaD domain protein [Clostridiaceae bacterium]|nr:DnaD domain protein [Clostridiaceae bacterium]
MKPEDRKKLLLSDTAVPDLFISDYMSSLTGSAVQAYLYLLMVQGNGYGVGEKEIASRLSLSPEEAKGAIAELTLSGLIDRNERGQIVISDIKASEVDRYILRNNRDGISENEPISPPDEAREELARSIERTFFHGSMAYKWYREIDTMLFEFGFDPDVIYSLFQSLYENNRLAGVSRVKEKAVEWQGKGIRNVRDLDAYLASEERVAVTLRKLGKRLRKKMTGFDEDYVRIWVEKMSFPYEMIEFAIQKVCEYSTVPSMKRANEHLSTWLAVGIKTLPEAKAFEEEQAKLNSARYQNEKAAKGNIGTNSSGQNFSGVTYTDEQLKSFEDDPEEILRRYSPETTGDIPR